MILMIKCSILMMCFMIITAIFWLIRIYNALIIILGGLIINVISCNRSLVGQNIEYTYLIILVIHGSFIHNHSFIYCILIDNLCTLNSHFIAEKQSSVKILFFFNFIISFDLYLVRLLSFFIVTSDIHTNFLIILIL